MSDLAKRMCSEICAYKGEAACWAIDAEAGEAWAPCEVCVPAAAVAERYRGEARAT
jgi:hypothetical protein